MAFILSEVLVLLGNILESHFSFSVLAIAYSYTQG